MIVYKTDDPVQLTSYEVWLAARKAWSAAANDIAEEVIGKREFLSWGSGAFAGLAHDGGDVPTGWRVGPAGHLVPNNRLKAGKDWQKRIDALPTITEAPRCDGQPGSVFHDAPNGKFYMHRPQYHRFTEDGPLFMIWHCDCGERGDKDYSIGGHVDAAIWQPVKLSEFYAEVEAEKERAA